MAGADSQASVDAIDLETARAAQLPIAAADKPSIASATGMPLSVVGVVRFVWIVVNGKRFQLRDVRVLPNLCSFAPLVLGAASLAALGISLVSNGAGLAASSTTTSHQFSSPANA